MFVQCNEIWSLVSNPTCLWKRRIADLLRFAFHKAQVEPVCHGWWSKFIWRYSERLWVNGLIYSLFPCRCWMLDHNPWTELIPSLHLSRYCCPQLVLEHEFRAPLVVAKKIAKKFSLAKKWEGVAMGAKLWGRKMIALLTGTLCVLDET